MSICDVCKKNDAIGVASSVLGALSLAYCAPCNEKGAEPYELLLGTMWILGGYEHSATWFKESVIPGSLEIAGKTMEEFLHDIEEQTKKMDESYEKYVENDGKVENYGEDEENETDDSE